MVGMPDRRLVVHLLVAVLVVAGAAACSDDRDDASSTTTSATDTAPDTAGAVGASTTAVAQCDTRAAVVTDIDETLTTSDGEFLRQLGDVTYDPAERPDASEMIQAYSDLGYYIVYVTGRAQEGDIPDSDMTTTELTETWLVDHGFPIGEGIGELHLFPPDSGTLVEYKADTVTALEDEGYEVAVAYGNADTDFESYSDAGLTEEQVFSIGRLAGAEGTTAIEGDGYTGHLAEFVEPLDPVC